jgi:biotin operon repressor
MAMPIRYQQERAAIARMLVSLFRMWADYYSNMQLVDTIEFGFVHLFVFLGDVDNQPMSVSKLSRSTGMSRATVVRRLQQLIERNYVKRRGRFYHVGDGALNPENIQMSVERTTAIITRTAKELSKMNTQA